MSDSRRELHRLTQVAAIGWLAAAVFGLGACEPIIRPQGASAISATYAYPRLEADLPDATRVPAAIAAADSTLRARGYSVEKSTSTEEAGVVRALPPRSSDYPVVEVNATRTTSGTHVTIGVTPFGDENLSRSVLDGMLSRLGL